MVLWIQIILVVGVILVGVYLTRPAGGDVHLALRRLFLVGFILVAVLSIVFPQWLSWIANILGVGRGADLLLYALVLAFLVFVSTSYRRSVQLDRKLTALTREVTLLEARARLTHVVDDAAAESTEYHSTPPDESAPRA